VINWLADCTLLHRLRTFKVAVDVATFCSLYGFASSLLNLRLVILEGSSFFEVEEGRHILCSRWYRKYVLTRSSDMELWSPTLECLEITATDHSGVCLMFGILNISEMLSLKTLHLMLPAPASHDRLPTGKDDTNFSFTEADFMDQYPRVTSLQVTVAVGDSSVDIAFLRKYVDASEFLHVVKSKGFLVVVYDGVRYHVSGRD
jgi:hypothetical protein